MSTGDAEELRKAINVEFEQTKAETRRERLKRVITEKVQIAKTKTGEQVAKIPFIRVAAPFYQLSHNLMKAVDPALPILGLVANRWPSIGYATTGLTVIGAGSRLSAGYIERYNRRMEEQECKDEELDETDYDHLYASLVRKYGKYEALDLEMTGDPSELGTISSSAGTAYRLGKVIVDVYGHDNDSYVTVKNADREEFKETLRTLIWSSAESLHATLYERKGLIAEPNLPDNLKFTEFAGYLERRMIPFIRKQRRSILLYGLPGEGKTTVIRMIAKKNNWRLIRIPNDTNINSTLLTRAIELFHPDVVVIDDIDRFPQSTTVELLALTEHIGETILVGTVNRIKKLDSALTRPGRFDELIEARGLTMREIHDYFIGSKMSDDQAKLVAAWPIAFVNELHTRITEFGFEDAIRDLTSLEERVAILREDYSGKPKQPANPFLKIEGTQLI